MRLNTLRDCTYTSAVRRLALLCCLLALPASALTRPLQRGSRIAVLRIPTEYAYEPELTVARTLERNLRVELRARGFTCYEAGMTLRDIQQRGGPDADVYVEFIPGVQRAQTSGRAGASVGPVAIDVAVVTAELSAQVRLYDARTLEPIGHYDLRRKQTAAVPAGIGIGGRSWWATLALPFVRYGVYRSAAHEVARDAAERIASQ